MFDVAMGCYDGAKVCKVVGLYILHKLSSKFPERDIGLYRDNGLAIFKNMNPRAGDKARKDFSKVIGKQPQGPCIEDCSAKQPQGGGLPGCHTKSDNWKVLPFQETLLVKLNKKFIKLRN